MTDEELEMLEQKYQAACEKTDVVLQDLMGNSGLSWEELVTVYHGTEEYKEYQKLRLEHILNCKYTLEDIPEYGDKFTIEEFTDCCKACLFVNSDGEGCYATDTQMSDVPAYPSDFYRDKIREGFTHVIWFNK